MRAWKRRSAGVRSRPRVPAAVVLASVLLFLASLLWSIQTPAFRAHDEFVHVNSVLRVADGGGWPAPGKALLEEEILFDALEISGARDGRLLTAYHGTYNPYPDVTYFSDVPPTPAADRPSFDELDDGRPPTPLVDQMTQHPPGYYAVAAAVYDLAGAGDWRYDHALLLLRAFSALTVAAVVPVCCYLATRAMTGREPLAKAAAFVPLLIPQLAYIGGAVNNDGAVIATAAIVWTLLLQITCWGPTPRRLVLLGVAVGAACWTKGTALTLLPAVPLALAIAYRRTRGGPLRQWALPAVVATLASLGLAFVLGGWWWAVNLLRYGTLQPPAVPTPLIEGEARNLAGFAVVFVTRLRWTLIGEMGGREPQVLYLLTATVAWTFLVLCLIGLVSRRRLPERLVIVISIVLTVGVLFSTAYTAHQLTKGFPGIQGRYLFVLVVPVAVLFVVGLARVTALVRLPERWLPAVTALPAVLVALLGLAMGFRVYYGGGGGAWGPDVDRFIAWAPVPPHAIVALVGVFALSCLALAWVLGAEWGTGRRAAPSSEQVNDAPLSGDRRAQTCATGVT